MREQQPLLRKGLIGFFYSFPQPTLGCYLASIDEVVDHVVGLHKG